MSLTDIIGILFAVSGLVVAGVIFFFRAGTVVDELAGAHDEVRRLRKRLPGGWLMWAFRALGIFLVLVGVAFGYVILRPFDPISSVLSTLLILCVLVFVGAGSILMMLRPRVFIVGMNPTLELIDRHLSDETTARVIRGFGGFVLLSSLFFLYLVFVY